MSSPKNDVKSTKYDADLAKWNLNMNVKVKNGFSKGNMISRRECGLFMLIFSTTNIVLILVLLTTLQIVNAKLETLTILKRDVQAIQIQVKSLTLRSQLDNRCVRSRRSTLHISTNKSSVPKFSKLESGNNSDSNVTFYYIQANQSIQRRLTDRNDTLGKSASDILNVGDTMSLIKSKNNSIVDSDEKRNLSRDARIIRDLSKKTQNYTTPESKCSKNDASHLCNKPRTRIARKSQKNKRRGKKRRQKGRRPNRGRLGPLLATFVGAEPEQLTNAVYIGPWIKSDKNNENYDFTRFHLAENNMSIEVTINGLFMISVQIFYFGESSSHSYWILLSSEGKSSLQKLVTCATTASFHVASEVSCSTSRIVYLKKGDRLRIQQQEKDRLINMREGYSYIQLLLLEGET